MTQSAAEPESDETLVEPGRVLLVDDQEELRRLYRRTLAKDGHDIALASNGREAIEQAREERFDVVITDVRMPDMGGLELLQSLRAADPDLPVVLVSGSPDLESAMKAVELGALEFLVKPVQFEKLRQAARRGIGIRRQRARTEEVLQQHRSGERRRPDARGGEEDGWTGELLAGIYRVGRLLGAGGMGRVYEATREDASQARVAVKILHRALAEDDKLVARFQREAEAVGLIDHPNIVRLLDFQLAEPPFLVMELLDGVSLRHALTRHGPFGPERAVLVASQMLEALGAVHRAHVIHRDIKPENVQLTSQGGADRVKLLDFGVAKLQSVPHGETLTQAGTVLGTPTYMAPEHARGSVIDVRSDLYSVAAILYEMLTGKAPFMGDNYNALLFAIQQGKPEPLAELRPDVPPELVAIIELGMSAEADDRYASAEEMAEALIPWQRSQSTVPPPPEEPRVFPSRGP
ncbi:MAG: response regulator [Myxococcales bacterium]|nr:MAG: response regulator [Myxococcales bacterium]